MAITVLYCHRHVHLQNVYGILLEFINLRVLYKQWIRRFEVKDINMFVASYRFISVSLGTKHATSFAQLMIIYLFTFRLIRTTQILFLTRRFLPR